MKQTSDFETLRDKVRDLGSNLGQKANIPMVAQKLELITDIQQEEWWRDATPESIESLRCDLRELVKFVDRSHQEIVYTDFTDELGELREAEVPTTTPAFSREQYRKKVETYLRSNSNHVAIAKLKRNLPLTDEDLTELEKMLFESEAVENRDKFEEVYGKETSLKLFVRKIVGLDRKAAKEAFSQYLDTNNFSANQIRFIENIIDYLTQNGVMSPGLLYEPPFTNWHSDGLDGVFADSDVDDILEILTEFETRAS
ncbi:type I restriction-modification enzyme R subunit C-terminal domain-containing protein [Roseofilum capinflatum]|uniref:Type I restriction-modification enzyme R subunit C-terminal domain-containing protein n=1 Tax=Roseofilum capinflatum BLCC-M114 TaxID=3022440 RepID=A0ABT7B282_9CYAN|nr:type I restriction-modification enzyme R subunit C-terminal domain-containing protein [Roseofilum capinflatum]MDJ1173277.1 type I restriction-modification enzyme R subunit C-terminal domain-containing protein [Roseofilum capinflatum BLCC-M114]